MNVAMLVSPHPLSPNSLPLAGERDAEMDLDSLRECHLFESKNV